VRERKILGEKVYLKCAVACKNSFKKGRVKRFYWVVLRQKNFIWGERFLERRRFLPSLRRLALLLSQKNALALRAGGGKVGEFLYQNGSSMLRGFPKNIQKESEA